MNLYLAIYLIIGLICVLIGYFFAEYGEGLAITAKEFENQYTKYEYENINELIEYFHYLKNRPFFSRVFGALLFVFIWPIFFLLVIFQLIAMQK